MERIWLGLGSNLGDSQAFIRKAARLLGEHLAEIRISGLWRSKPRYNTDQPDFLNAVLTGLCEHKPLEFLDLIHNIEVALGRDRASVPSKGARTIDIDILLYGERIITEENFDHPSPRNEGAKVRFASPGRIGCRACRPGERPSIFGVSGGASTPGYLPLGTRHI